MSLSPRDYERAIGIARTEHGSVLVYLDDLTGEGPSACDGWDVELRGDMLFRPATSFYASMRYPPEWDDASGCYKSGPESWSRALAARVIKIREKALEEHDKTP